jgi:hypothetical protein|nr:MAG TPA: Protein of unknown function (DUF3199) [Caudoviricetes sp.]
MIDAICASLRNYFVVEIVDGEYTVTDGGITLPFLAAGQFFRVVGSVFCDGVYRCGDKLPADETFDGAIWAMAIPPALEAIAAEIEEWKAKNADVLASPYQSESFGGYSYSKGTGSDSASWQGAFASRLNRWRKI